MNREQDTAYKAIVEAVREVNCRRTFGNIGTPGREDLDKAVLLLEELSWKIISGDIAKFSVRMADAAKDLKVLARRIDKSHKRLKTAAAVIKKAADAAVRAAAIAVKVT
jgi:tRNA A-37 threonylcarbamoyl transferase component Bud32